MVGAARKREESLKHILLCGPPGLGKTTLAHIIGRELKREVRITSGPVMTSPRPGRIAYQPTGRRPSFYRRDSPNTQNRGRISLLGNGRLSHRHYDRPRSQCPKCKVEVPRFTLVGATTRVGLLTSHAKSFHASNQIDYYKREELTKIVLRSRKLLDCPIDQEGAKNLPGGREELPHEQPHPLH